ncbi:hypothetical protein Cgig2_031223 [Carnegiea gigantea]|uniref:Tetratricopeptide repeat protein 38 n=1 Tax=Carnegiea gigantea TaxID=171969 RepID=A0A9Q1QMD5_9CARY|nr:hypothetical protein Cgig2_031223 [Carnegiea gigantea]
MGEEDKGLKLDKWGYQVKTSSDKCIYAINEFYDQVLKYGRRRSIILEAPGHDEHCVLGNILAAHYLSSTGSSKASCFLQAAKSHYDEATAYEKAVFDAVSYLISEDRDDELALELHTKLLRDFPRDLVTLKRAHLLCFYMGHPSLFLDVVEQVLPKNEQEAYIYGMLAFPLLELGRMDEAERASRKALEINQQDLWAQHCVSLIFESYSPLEKVLDVYDHHIIAELHRPDAAHPEVYLNAIGLLLRLHVRGDISLYEDRLETLASHLTDQAIWYMEWHLDVLILWALARTGKLSPAQELIEGLRTRVSNMNKKKQQKMQRGLSLAEALYEYGRGDDERAVELLGLDFNANDYKAIGASDEQLDVFNEVWYTLLLNTRQASKAIEVIERKLKERDGLPFLWRLLAKGYLMMGREEAASATEKANALERAYFDG